MGRETTTITIILELGGTEYLHQVEGTHWTHGGAEESVYVYDDNAPFDDPLIEVDIGHFAGAFREDDVETIGTITT